MDCSGSILLRNAHHRAERDAVRLWAMPFDAASLVGLGRELLVCSDGNMRLYHLSRTSTFVGTCVVTVPVSWSSDFRTDTVGATSSTVSTRIVAGGDAREAAAGSSSKEKGEEEKGEKKGSGAYNGACGQSWAM